VPRTCGASSRSRSSIRCPAFTAAAPTQAGSC
jgi:hypothetical protein